MGAYPPLGHDSFIIGQLAFELSDTGWRLGLEGAFINDRVEGFRRRWASECGYVLCGNHVLQPSPRFLASVQSRRKIPPF
jgi:hypothetical protein